MQSVIETSGTSHPFSSDVIKHCTISAAADDFYQHENNEKLASSFDLTPSSSSSSSSSLEEDKHLVKDSQVQQFTQAKDVAPVYKSPFRNQNYTNLLSSSRVLFATDEWFARADNLLLESDPVFVPDLYCEQGKVMDGWETRRRRDAGHDWCVIAAAHMGEVYGIEIDTAFFTGNQAPRISIEVANCYDQSKDEEDWKFKWMPGAVLRLAQGGGIQGTGMSPHQVDRAAAACSRFQWTEILPMTKLYPGYEETRMHYFTIPDDVRENTKGFTHVRVNYFPDGGVARLRLWGHSVLEVESSTNDPSELAIPVSAKPYPDPELSCEDNGGCGLECSNKHYGVPSNLIRSSYGKDMGDGWETARHPERPPVLIKCPTTNLVQSPLMDWAVLKLGMGGCDDSGISRIIIDTKHFRGNFPESVQVEGCDAGANGGVSDDAVCAATPETSKEESAVEWFPLLNRSRMGPHREHVFDRNSCALVNTHRRVTHVRVSIFPDGGLSRVRIYGQPRKNIA
jgi:allantoicase